MLSELLLIKLANVHYSFIHSRIYKVPLQEIYSEAPQPNHSDTDQS